MPRRIAQFCAFDGSRFGDALSPLLMQQRVAGRYLIEPIAPTDRPTPWADGLQVRSVGADLLDGDEPAGVLLGPGSVIAPPLLWLGAGVLAAQNGTALCLLAPRLQGPFDPALAPWLDWLLAGCQLLAVADEQSRQALPAAVREEAIVVPALTWRADLLWDRALLAEGAREQLAELGLSPGSGYVAIDLGAWNGDARADHLAGEIAAIARRADCRPLVLDSQAGTEPSELAGEVAALLGEPAPLARASRMASIAGLIADARMYVGASPHGLLTALAFGVPALGVASTHQPGAAELSSQLAQVGAEELLVYSWAAAASRTAQEAAASESLRTAIHARARSRLDAFLDRAEAVLEAPVDVERGRHRLAALRTLSDPADDAAPALTEAVAEWLDARRRAPASASAGAAAAGARRERRLTQRLDATAAELRAARAERDRIAETADAMRASTVELQRALHDADGQVRTLEQQLERTQATRREAQQQSRQASGELARLRWRASDRELTLREARELFTTERAMVEELAAELRLALADLHRAEATLGRALTHTIASVTPGAGKRTGVKPLYAGLGRLDELEQRLRKRPRPMLAPRPSRVGSARKKVTVIAWEVGHNPVGRAHALAEMVGRSHEVEIIGTQFPKYGSEIWAPLRGSEVPIRALAGGDLPAFVADVEEFVRTVRTDLVYVSKPRFPALLMAMLIKHLRGVPVILDVDDRELSFFDATTGISLEELEARRGEPDFVLPYGETWTRACDGLIADADALTVSSQALQDVYGGTIVPHARNERLMNPALYDREALRAELGYTPEDRVLLFAGTPRAHKGLVELAGALEEIGDARYKLCVIDSMSDAKLRRDLAAFGPDRVKLIEYRPWNEVAATTIVGDLVCLLQRADSEITRYQTPAKITDAMAMGVPVLAREAPPIAPFAEAGVIELVDERPLWQQIDALLSDPGWLRARAAAARRYYLKHLSYATVTETIDGVIAGLKDHSTDPSPSWRRAVAIAQQPTAQSAVVPAHSDAPAPAAPSRRPSMRHPRWDVIFFWKQNDSWIYGRRSDMLMKYLARSDRTRRLVHFDAPLSPDDVESYRRRARGMPGDQAAAIYKRARRQAVIPERHGKLRSYTFLARSESASGGWQQAVPPAGDEYLGYIEQVLKRSGIGKRPTLFWVWPANFQFPEIHRSFSPTLTIADVIDDQRSWVKPGARYYEQLSDNYEEVLSVSDVVLANCEPVRERMSWFGVDPVVIPNAAEIFGKPLPWQRRPAELRRLPGPIIGYVGNLSARMDLPLLERIASERPEWQLVMIGSAHLEHEVLALDAYPNIHFLGVKRYPEVTHYIRCFDAAIIPHRDNQLTRSMNPLKAYVYAGCGVPVVTTEIANLPELGGSIRITATHDEFIAALESTISQRRAGVSRQPPPELLEHTWQERVTRIERILDSAGELVGNGARSS